MSQQVYIQPIGTHAKIYPVLDTKKPYQDEYLDNEEEHSLYPSFDEKKFEKKPEKDEKTERKAKPR
jgi:hypothetical protein